VLSLLTEYSVYIPIFISLFYIDNRYRYFDPLTGKKDNKILKKDLKKLFTAFLISEIAYSLSKVSLTYQFLQLGALPYQASMFGSLTASVVSFILINLAAFKIVKLFRK
jgi:large-conductance mechanosensitive channel